MLTARDRHFELDGEAIGGWRARDPAGAAFYAGLSALFPQGERFFMDSVRRFRELADRRLAADVAQFLAQEALHTREHVALNASIAAAADLAPLEARAGRELGAVRRRSPLAQLAMTAALEHFTAALAHQLIAEPRHLQAAAPEARRLWLWHAAEEIEHKAVAFDLLSAATRDWSGARRWLFRNAVYVEAMLRLFRVVIPNYAALRGGRGRRLGWIAELAGLLLVAPGLLRDMLPQLVAFFRPGFHPWQLEDAHLLATALAA